MASATPHKHLRMANSISDLLSQISAVSPLQKSFSDTPQRRHSGLRQITTLLSSALQDTEVDDSVNLQSLRSSQSNSLRSGGSSDSEDIQKHYNPNTTPGCPFTITPQNRWSLDLETTGAYNHNTAAAPPLSQPANGNPYAEVEDDRRGYPLTSTFSNDSSIYPVTPTQRTWHLRTKSSISIRDRIKAKIATTKLPTHRFTSSRTSNNLSTFTPRTSSETSALLSASGEIPVVQQVKHRKQASIIFAQQGKAPERPLPPLPEQIPNFEALLPVELYREQLRRNSATSMHHVAAELSRYSSLRASIEINDRFSYDDTAFQTLPSNYASAHHSSPSTIQALDFPPLSSSRFDIQNYIHALLQSNAYPIVPPTLIHNLTTSGYDLWEMTYTSKTSANAIKIEFFSSLIRYGLSTFQVDLLHDEMLREGKRVERAEKDEIVRALRSRRRVRSLRHVSFDDDSFSLGFGDALRCASIKVGGGVAAREYYDTKRRRASTWPSWNKKLNDGKTKLNASPVATILAPLHQDPKSAKVGGAQCRSLQQRASTGVTSLRTAKSYLRNKLEVQLRHG